MTTLSRLRGAVVWLTGAPASGKTTLARGLVEALRASGEPVLWLDSDDLRPVLAPGEAYDPAGRDRFYAALGHLAVRAAAGAVTTVVSATASRRHYRDDVRRAVPRFIEVLVTCDPLELRRRDPKGLYAAADAGELDHLPGVGAAFEDPAEPDAVVDTTGRDPEAVLTSVLDALDR